MSNLHTEHRYMAYISIILPFFFQTNLSWSGKGFVKFLIIVSLAWNGGICVMEWSYRIAHVPNATLSFPDKVGYFMDPLQISKKHSGCVWSPSKSKLQNFSLGPLYQYINQISL